MVVIYTPVYLTKLWTVYEIACFLSFENPVDRMSVVPTFTPIVLLGGIVTFWATQVLHVTIDVCTGIWWVVYVAYPFGYCVLMWILRRWARRKIDVRSRLERFRVDECTCFLEADRPVVQRNIILLMQAIGEVQESAPDEAALEAFDQRVRRELPGAFLGSVGVFGLRYKHVIALFACSYLPEKLDVMAAGLNHGLSARWSILLLVYSLTWVA